MSQNQNQTTNLAANTEELLKLANTLVESQTKKPTLVEKIKSRKFWVAAAGCICGICGMIGFNQNTTAIIVFAVLEIISILAYCASEGIIDAKRSKQLVDATITLLEMIGGNINAKDYVEGNYDVTIQSGTINGGPVEDDIQHVVSVFEAEDNVTMQEYTNTET